MTTRTSFPERLGTYRMPRAIEDADDAARLRGTDLPAMTSRRLYAEKVSVSNAIAAYQRLAESGKQALVFDPDQATGSVPAADWLFERIAAVERELSRRKVKGRSR